MKRPILAFAAGLVLWVVVWSVLNRGLRIFVMGYAAAEPTFSFTLGMLTLRLAIAALTSLIAGAVVAWIAPSSLRVPVLVGATLLAYFIWGHVRDFSLFPLWCHLVFLVTLIPLVMLGLGARLARVRAVRGAAHERYTHVS
jgi:hypothetical protein